MKAPGFRHESVLERAPPPWNWPDLHSQKLPLAELTLDEKAKAVPARVCDKRSSVAIVYKFQMSHRRAFDAASATRCCCFATLGQANLVSNGGAQKIQIVILRLTMSVFFIQPVEKVLEPSWVNEINNSSSGQ
jgi:hypothetical protein